MLFCNVFVFQLTVLLTLVRDYYSSVDRGAVYRDERASLSVSLRVCLAANISTRLIFIIFVHVTAVVFTLYNPLYDRLHRVCALLYVATQCIDMPTARMLFAVAVVCRQSRYAVHARCRR